jgi:putative MFS transporter
MIFRDALMVSQMWSLVLGRNLMNTDQNAYNLVRPENITMIAARFERLPFTRYQLTLFLIIATAWFFDSIDLGALTFLLGSIKEEFQLNTAQAGLLSSMSFLGMFIGASLAGMAADRFGRKTVFQISMLFWGFGSLLCGISPNVTWLGFARVIVGFGMGMEFPVAQALASEIAPANNRGRYIAILEGFWPIGFIAAGLIAFAILPIGGWRAVFIIEGLPALFVFVVRRFVPESPRWLVAHGQIERAETVMTEIEQNVQKRFGSKPLPSPTPLTLENAAPQPFRLAFLDIWSGIYVRRTIMLWILWFFALLGYYGLTTWLSALLQQSGYPATKSVYYTVLISLAGIPGFLTAAWLIEVWGRKYIIATLLLGGAVASYFYGTASDQTYLIAFGLAMQFCLFGMWSVLYAYTPELYPTRARATGAGCASAVGRLGALLGPYVVGIILPIFGEPGVFALGAGAFVVAALTVLFLGEETKAKIVEHIAQ